MCAMLRGGGRLLVRQRMGEDEAVAGADSVVELKQALSESRRGFGALVVRFPFQWMGLLRVCRAGCMG